MLADQFISSWEELVNFDRLREYRLSRTLHEIKRLELDGVILFKADNIRYVSSIRPLIWEAGYQTRNFVILNKEGDISLFVASGDYQRVKLNNPWLSNVKPLASMEDAGIARRVVSDSLIPEIKRMNLGNSKIGLDVTTFYTTDFIRKSLREIGSDLDDSGETAIREARTIKSDDEMRLIQAAGGIVDAGLAASQDNIFAGNKENSVAGQALLTMYSLGTEWMPANPAVCSGNPYRRFSTDKIIRYGENVLVNLSAMNDGYCAEATRTFSVGNPTEAKHRSIDNIREAYSRLLGLLKSGLSIGDLTLESRNVLLEFGLERNSRVSLRGAGLSLTDLPIAIDITHDSTVEGSEAVLKPGMALIPELRIDDNESDPTIFSDTLQLTDQGIAHLTRYQSKEEW